MCVRFSHKITVMVKMIRHLQIKNVFQTNIILPIILPILTRIFSQMYAEQEDKLRESMFHVKKWRKQLTKVKKILPNAKHA